MTQKLHSRYILRRNGNVYLCKHPYINIHSNIIHNSQKVEITQMPWWTGKKKCVIFTQYSVAAAAAAAKWLQSCPTLCDPIDSSPPGSPVPGILQARTLEWVAISFSNAWKWKVKVKSLSRVRLLGTPWTAAYQAPLSMEFFQARVLEWGQYSVFQS